MHLGTPRTKRQTQGYWCSCWCNMVMTPISGGHRGVACLVGEGEVTIIHRSSRASLHRLISSSIDPSVYPAGHRATPHIPSARAADLDLTARDIDVEGVNLVGTERSIPISPSLQKFAQTHLHNTITKLFRVRTLSPLSTSSRQLRWSISTSPWKKPRISTALDAPVASALWAWQCLW